MSIAAYTKQQIDTAPVDAGYRLSDMDESSNYMQNLAAEKAAAVERKRSSLKPYSDLDKDSYTMMPDGMIEDNKNKVFNNYSDDDYASMFSYAVGKYGLQPTHDGNWVDPQGKVYKSSETRSLYGYGTKESDDAFKMGIAANLGDGNSDYRYLEGRAKELGLSDTYKGWGSGVLGVDTSKKQFDIVLPHDVATMLEGLQHGRAGAMEDRLVRDVNSPMAESLYGSGKSEYYTDMQSVLPTKGKTAGMSLEDAAAAFEGKRAELADKGLIRGSAGQSTFDPVAYNEQVQKAKADRMGVGDRLGNTLAGVGKSFVQNLALDTADWVGETLKSTTGYGWDVGTEKEKADMASKLFGYNQVLAERGMEEAKGHVQALWDAATKEDKEFDLGNVVGLVKTVFTTPELIGESLGYMAAMLPGLHAKAGMMASKAKAVMEVAGKADDSETLNKATQAYKMYSQQAAVGKAIGWGGLVNVAAGDVNDQIDDFKENNNGVPPSAAEVVFRMMPIAVAATALDKLSLSYSMGLMGDAAKVGKEVVKDVVDTLPEQAQKQLLGKAMGVVGDIGKAAGVEAAQEYTQTMAEIFNKQYGTDKYGNDVGEILTIEENVVEGLTGAAMGAGMGAQMKIGSMAVEALPGAGKLWSGISDKMSNKTDSTATAPTTEEATEDDKQKYINATDKLVTMLDTTGFTKDNILDALDQVNTLTELRASVKKSAKPEKLAEADAFYKEAAEGINKYILNNPDTKLSKVPTNLGSNNAKPVGAVEGYETPVETDYNDAARKADAELMLHTVFGSRPITEDMKSLGSAYGKFATANGIEAERFNQIVKSYEAVEEEATVGDRGYNTYSSKLNKLLASGNPDTTKLNKLYGNLVGFLSSTNNSISNIEAGLESARLKADSLNKAAAKGVSSGNKPVVIVTDYLKNDGKKFEINIVKGTDGKWVVQEEHAAKLIASKTNTSRNIENIINEYNSKASSYIKDISNLGAFIVPKSSTGAGNGIDSVRNKEAGFIRNEVNTLNKVTQTGRSVNKVIVDTDTGGYSKKWVANGDYRRSNATLINTGAKGQTYTADDVVLVHAMKPHDVKSNGKVVKTTSILNYTKEDSPAVVKEFRSAIDAGATIILDSDYKETKSSFVTGKDGKRYAKTIKGRLNPVGRHVEDILVKEGYVRVPGTSATFVKPNSSNAQLIIDAAERIKQEHLAENQMRINKAKAIEYSLILDKAKELGLTDEEIVEAKEKLAHYTAAALPAFDRKVEAKHVDGADTEANIEEMTDDVREGDLVDQDSVSLEENPKEANDNDALSVAHKNTPEEKLQAYIKREMKLAVAEAYNAAVKDANEAATLADLSEYARGEVQSKAAMAAYYKAKDMVASNIVADAEITQVLTAWSKMVEEGVTGKELEDGINTIIESSGIQLLTDSDGHSLELNKDILSRGIGLGREPIWETTWSKISGEGKSTVVKVSQNKPTDEEMSNERKESIGKGVYVPVSTKEISIDPTDYITSSGTSTLLSRLTISALPVDMRTAINNFKTKLEATIASGTAAEGSSKMNDRKGKANFYGIDSPARGLLFSKEGTVSPQVVGAMYLAVVDTLFTDKSKLMLGYRTKEDVAQMFGVHESQVTKEMMKFAKNHGQLRKTLANSIGKEVLKQLGFTKLGNADVHKGQYETFVADMGNIALVTAESMGLLTTTKADSNEVAKLFAEGEVVPDSEATTSFMNIPANANNPKIPNTTTEKHIEMFKDMSDKGLLPGVKTREKWPNRKPLDAAVIDKRLSEVRNDATGFHEIPEEAKETLSNYMNTEWQLDVEGVKEFLELPEDQIKARLGYVEEGSSKFDELSYDNKEIQVAINRDVEKSYSVLQEAVKRGMGTEEGNKLFFEFYYTLNGRYMLDSNTLQPQTDKAHRFLVQPTAHRITHKVTTNSNGGKEFSVDGKDTSYSVRLALSQAMGVGIDKEMTEDIITYGNALLSMNSKQIAYVRNKLVADGEVTINIEGFGDMTLEAEHITHTLQALRFLEAVQNGNEVTSSLTAEYDSLTSGFMNKLQQVPLLGDVPGHAARTGVFVEDYLDRAAASDEEWSKNPASLVDLSKGEGTNALLSGKGSSKGFLDSYKNLASIVGKIVSDPTVWAKNIVGSRFKDFLPKTVNGVITKELRNMFKPGFMTFNYSASINSIKERLAYDLVEGLIKDLAKGKDKGKLIAEVMKKEGITVDGKVLTVEGYIKAAREKPSYSFKLGNRSFFDSMERDFKEVYGDAVAKAFETEFASFIALQDTINDAFKISYRLFAIKLSDKVKEITKEKGKMTEADYKSALDSLINEFPYIVGPMTTGSKDVIVVTGSEKGLPVYAQKSPQTPIKAKKDGDPVSVKVNAIIRSIGEPVKSGSVLPFHYIDGAELGRMTNAFVNMLGGDLNKAGITAIHDAIMPRLDMSDEAGWLLNKGIYETNKDYSLIDSLIELTSRWEWPADHIAKDISTRSLTIAKEMDKPSIQEVANALITRLKAFKVKIDDNRKKYFFGDDKKVVYNNIVGTPGQAYVVGSTAPDISYLSHLAGSYKASGVRVEGMPTTGASKTPAGKLRDWLNSPEHAKIMKDNNIPRDMLDSMLKALEGCK